MDALKKLIKRFALHIVRDELERRDRQHATSLRYAQEMLSERVREVTRLRRSISRTSDVIHRGQAWLQKHSPANMEARALLETIQTVPDAGFGIVHPFDRWGISPKP